MKVNKIDDVKRVEVVKTSGTRPVVLEWKNPDRRIEFESLGAAAKYLKTYSQYLKSYLDGDIHYMGTYGCYIYELEKPKEYVNALF